MLARISLIACFLVGLSRQALTGEYQNGRELSPIMNSRTAPNDVVYLPRQNPDSLTSTTSSFNWWPYPPWGATASTTSSSTSSSSRPSSSSAASSTITSASSTPSLINMTALPPTTLSLPPTLPKLPNSHAHTHAFHTVYLIPLIAGLALGSVAAWLFYGIYTARRRPPARTRRRRAGWEFESGPSYERQLQDVDIEGGGSPSKYSLHGTLYPDRRRSARRNGASPRTRLTRGLSPRASTPASFMWPAVTPTPYHEEDDPFLALPVPARVHAPAGPTRAPSLLGEHEREYASAELEVPPESVRHKSIRCGLLERVRFEDDEKGVTRAREDEDGERRSDVDETEWVAGSGFRIVEEHLEVLQRRMARGASLSCADEPGDGANAKAGKKPRKRVPADGYARLPVRVDSSVLPRSPPQISSPPLDSRLSFVDLELSRRTKALGRVEQIVRHSWSQRDVSEVERVASPTLYGAKV